ncbi:MAG: NTP transferase domain-containing protein [Enterobacterales bacterium]|nr:NTP transferase domain-containing protein [Enterobacterales bacterium]
MMDKKVTGLILAGGAGRRVKGKDKGWLVYKGLSLVEHQINWLKPQVDQIIISANRNIADYQKLGYPVLEDELTGFHGPLQGIVGGLALAEGLLWVQPVDMPELPVDIIKQAMQVMNNDVLCAYLATKQRNHYLSMLMDSACLDRLKTFVRQGNARVSDFHRLVSSQIIQLNIAETYFKNLNDLLDYR